MRTALLIAGSTLALAIAAPAFAQTGAVNTVTKTVPAVGGLPSAGLPATPVVKPRVGHSNRPSLKARAPIARAPLVGGNTVAQVKAPRHPGDTRLVKVRSSSTRGLTGSGTSAAVKRNGVQAVAIGHGTGANTKKLGLPLTAANAPVNTVGRSGQGALTSVSNTTGVGKTLGASPNGHGVLGANISKNPGLVTNTGGGRKH